jgi:hypothetical protein
MGEGDLKMDDEFLYGLRQSPPPEFATSLEQRLCAERLRSARSPQVLKVAACVAVLVVTASVFASGSRLEWADFDKVASLGERFSALVRAPIQERSQDFNRKIDSVKHGETSRSASRNPAPAPSGRLIQGPVPGDPNSCGAPGETVRPIVGNPLVDAAAFLKSGRSAEALARAQEAERVPNKTAFEACMVARVLMAIERKPR